MAATKMVGGKWIAVFWDVTNFRYFIVLLKYSQHGLTQTLVSLKHYVGLYTATISEGQAGRRNAFVPPTSFI